MLGRIGLETIQFGCCRYYHRSRCAPPFAVPITFHFQSYEEEHIKGHACSGCAWLHDGPTANVVRHSRSRTAELQLTALWEDGSHEDPSNGYADPMPLDDVMDWFVEVSPEDASVTGTNDESFPRPSKHARNSFRHAGETFLSQGYASGMTRMRQCQSWP